MRSIRRFAPLSGLVLLGLLLAGCFALPGTSPSQPEPPVNPPPSSSAPTEPPPLPPATPSDPASTDPSSTGSPTGAPSASPSPAEPPAATRTATIDGQRVTLTVFPLRRTGTLSVLDFTLGRPAAETGQESDTLLLTTSFNDNNSSTGDRGPYSVDGIRLVDSRSRKAYLVASETGGRCLCSNDLNTLSLKPGDTYDFYATFAAPPAAVTELDVNVPRFGAIPRVPVQ